ncbi:N-acetylmuramoyl-L-alanine amidase [Paracoccaceae bacterium GXU_MW_L88]
MMLSPSHGERRDGGFPQLIVLHYTAMESARAAFDRLCNPAVEVSAHYLISEVGEVQQLVAEDRRAWHAGAGQWGEITDVNSHSIGIELALHVTDDRAPPFPAKQMDALESLLRGLMARYSLGPHRVIGHSDLAPGRKNDPGRAFDWRRLARQGLSVWYEPQADQPATQTDFFENARRFGYPPAEEAAVLDAFRQRFRPWDRSPGPNDADRAAVADLAARYPVDLKAAQA